MASQSHESKRRLVVCEVCGKAYATQRGLDNHLERRLCRPPTAIVEMREEDPVFACEVEGCVAVFTTFTGMRLHVCRTHPREYNASLEREAAGAREKWSGLELDRMALEEARLPPKAFVNQALARIFTGRTLDQIKGQRRKPDYKATVERYRVDILEAGLDPDQGPPTPPATRSPTQEIRDDNLQIVADAFVAPRPIVFDDPILAYLHSLDGDGESEEARFTSEFRTLLPRGTVGVEAIDRLADSIVAGTGASTRHNRRHKPHRGKGRGTYRRGRGRAACYKVAQQLYTADRKRCANHILNDVPWITPQEVEGPTSGEVLETYGQLWGSSTNADEERFEPKRDVGDINTLYAPITEGEILEVIRTSKSESPGPDGVRLTHVKAMPIRKLTLLYNGMLFTGHTPTVLKACRTVLIPKSGELRSVHNWRPITISSVLLRVCNKVLGKRLGAIPINANQRGFRSVDGCLANNLILSAIIHEHRKRAAPYHIMTLDLSKAFDTVGHESVIRGLRRYGIDERFIKYIKGNYDGAETNIFMNKRSIGQVSLDRGVKQGDPLSPALFNLVLDELMDKLPADAGLEINGRKVSCLAYADDLVLLAPSTSAMRELLRKCKTFFESRGLSLNGAKCKSLSMNVVPRKKKLFPVTTTLHYICGRGIEQVAPLDMYKYLGQQYSYDGIRSPDVGAIRGYLEKVQSAPLKPSQKMNILRFYLLPRVLHELQNPRVNGKVLRSVDRLVRISVRKILHLNKTCSSAFLHADVKGGGLGIPAFAHTIPRIILSRIDRLRHANDPVLSAMLESSYVVKFVQAMRQLLNGVVPSPEGLKNHWRRELEQSYSGNGLLQGANSGVSGSWVYRPPKYWTGREHIQAIQLRGNLLPTVGIPSNPPEARMCRAGCLGKTESLCHVLQSCATTHWSRIRRHDALTRMVSEKAVRRGWTVEYEPQFCLPTGRLIPDLVMTNGREVVVCDATVVWEGPRALSAAYHEKVQKYNHPELMAKLRTSYPGLPIVHAPLVVGARGIWCALNRTISQKLDLSRWDQEALISATILGSLKIHRLFNKSVWRRRR